MSDFAGVRRIHFIFDRGLRKFKGDVRFWLQYIDFAHRAGSTHALGRILAKYGSPRRRVGPAARATR